MTIEELKKNLYKSYSRDLCYHKNQTKWSESNKSLGMCAITSLIVNDYFKGDICKIHIDDINHYFNLVNNEIVDLTSSQFKHKIDYKNYEIIPREKLTKNKETTKRYKKLKEKVILEMLSDIDININTCNNCQNLVEKFPNDKTVYLGKNNDILLIGEAPANNGWRKSHKLWKDINDKILPSGVILQRLFDIIDRNIFDTTFLESVKCFPIERKNLKTCSNNCKEIMLKQIEILNPKLIITLGEFPTRNLLNFKFNKFSDVVGNIYEIDNYKVLPIYHPSPISPKSYKGNVPIFEEIKKKNNSHQIEE